MIPIIDIGTIAVVITATFAIGFVVGFCIAAWCQVMLDRKKKSGSHTN